MTPKLLRQKLNLIDSVLGGVMPTGNYKGQRYDRQCERIEEAQDALSEVYDHLILTDPNIIEPGDE